MTTTIIEGCVQTPVLIAEARSNTQTNGWSSSTTLYEITSLWQTSVLVYNYTALRITCPVLSLDLWEGLTLYCVDTIRRITTNVAFNIQLWRIISQFDNSSLYECSIHTQIEAEVTHLNNRIDAQVELQTLTFHGTCINIT